MNDSQNWDPRHLQRIATDLKTEKENRQMTAPNELTALLEEYRDLKVELAYPLEKLATLEKRIREHVRDTGETAEVDGARVTVRPGTVRVHWDTKALDGYAAAYPEILALRSERETAPIVSIKVD